MVRKLSAIVIGTLVAFGLVATIEMVGHMVYPPPADLDFTDPASRQAYVSGLPVGAFLFVMAAWALGAFGGGTLAGFVGRERNLALIIGALILIASIINLWMITHPVWFSVTSLIAIVVTTLLARHYSPKSS